MSKIDNFRFCKNDLRNIEDRGEMAGATKWIVQDIFDEFIEIWEEIIGDNKTRIYLEGCENLVTKNIYSK